MKFVQCLRVLTLATLACSTIVPTAFAKPNGVADKIPGAYQPPMSIDKFSKPIKLKAYKQGDKNAMGPTRPSYQMNVVYDSEKHKINGTMKVSFENNLDVALEDLYFNLWGNADVFSENGGGMDVENVKVNGKDADFKVDGTALHISDVEIKKNKKASVEMDFEVSLPNQQDRFGWDGTTVSLGNWFPILAVYDNEGWNVDPYYPYGESFYSLSGSFDVTFTTDKSQVIAATGTEVGKPKIRGEFATHRYQASNVRDFAMQLDPTYKVNTERVNGVTIHVYYTDKQAKYADSMMEAGKKSITLFSDKFGAYPWPELDITSMEGWFGGMEYPQLVMISLAGERRQEWVKSVTAHEIGHQWFYGIIGDNEYDEPWLDESFASFAAALHDDALDELTADPDENEIYHLSSPVSLFTAHADEGGIGAYYDMIYDYGARTLNDLRLELGDEQFFESMQKYFKEKKFGVSTTADFIRIMEETSGEDLTDFFADHRVFVSDQE